MEKYNAGKLMSGDEKWNVNDRSTGHVDAVNV